MGTVRCCQFDQVLSLGFVYVHNPERSLPTEEQIITACVCKFIRVLFWNFLRPQLYCCVLRKENVHPPMDRSSILPAVIRAMITKINVSYIPMIPSLCASLDKMSFACGCNLFGRPNSTVIEMKGWGRCQSKRLEASSYQAVGRKDSDT